MCVLLLDLPMKRGCSWYGTLPQTARYAGTAPCLSMRVPECVSLYIPVAAGTAPCLSQRALLARQLASVCAPLTSHPISKLSVYCCCYMIICVLLSYLSLKRGCSWYSSLPQTARNGATTPCSSMRGPECISLCTLVAAGTAPCFN